MSQIVLSAICGGLIRDDCALQRGGISELLAGHFGPRQVGVVQTGRAQVRPAQIGPTQVGPAQIGPAQIGSVQSGQVKVCQLENSTVQISRLKAGSAQIGTGKITITRPVSPNKLTPIHSSHSCASIPVSSCSFLLAGWSPVASFRCAREQANSVHHVSAFQPTVLHQWPRSGRSGKRSEQPKHGTTQSINAAR
jgi:hypothetical protein